MKKEITYIGNDTIQKVSKADFNTFSVEILKTSLENLSAKKKVINIALSGGSTPLPILEKLKEIQLDWVKFNFFLVDERVVDVDSNESNYKNINEVLYQHISSTSFPVLLESSSLEQMLLNYKKQIKKNVLFNKEGVPIFDLIILGMGTDGHTASLFPETKALFENDDFLVENFVPKLNKSRITLTFPTLLNAYETIVLIKGEEKVTIFEEIMSGKGKKYPMSKLKNSKLNWIIGF